jgi:hypothetical protein
MADPGPSTSFLSSFWSIYRFVLIVNVIWSFAFQDYSKSYWFLEIFGKLLVGIFAGAVWTLMPALSGHKPKRQPKHLGVLGTDTSQENPEK